MNPPLRVLIATPSSERADALRHSLDDMARAVDVRTVGNLNDDAVRPLEADYDAVIMDAVLAAEPQSGERLRARGDVALVLLDGDGADAVPADAHLTDARTDPALLELVLRHAVKTRRLARALEESEARLRGLTTHAGTSEERSRLLAEAGAALDSSLDYTTTLPRLARVLVPRLADWAVIQVVDENGAHCATAVHADAALQPAVESMCERFPPAADGRDPASLVLADGQPRLLAAEDVRAAGALAASQAELLERAGGRSLLCAPLFTRGERIGVLSLGSASRDFDDADLSLATELARRAAQAVDNSRLYQAAVSASQAKSDFLAVVSHELRTPLNAIMGYTEIMLAGIAGELSDKQTESMQRISASARHLLQIIEEILTYARMEAGREEVHLSALSLGELIEDVIVVSEPLVRERGLHFAHRIDGPETRLLLDAAKLRQILLNLLSNAVKFTEKGEISLEAEVRDAELLCRVTDTGIGIESADQPFVFDAFWQVEQASTRQAGGTGLGLSVSRRLAEMLGGDIELESEPGRGSTFLLRVPARALQGDAE